MRSRLIVGGVGLGAGALAGRRAGSRWAEASDPCRPGDHEPLPATPFKVTTTDGAVLAGGVAGSGPLVVLAHGWTNASSVWRPVAHRLVDAGLQVAWYDQRGHGDSTVGAGGYAIERLGADLAEVLDVLDAHDAVLAGHSMGGMTIQALAGAQPAALEQRARALVLVATAAKGLGTAFNRPGVALLGSTRLHAAMNAPGGYALLREVVGRHPVRDHLVRLRDMFVACPSESRREFYRSMMVMDLTQSPDLGRLRLPTTVLSGSADLLTPPARANEIVAAVPGAQLVRLAGLGHMLPWEAPDVVAAHIAEAAAR